MASSTTLASVEAPPRMSPEPVLDSMPDLDTNATRHLSAGAYLDEEFCLSVLREIYYRRKRIVAPSYGFDTLTVLGHCLRARRALIVRDAALVGLLVFAWWLSIVGFLTLLTVLLAAHVLATAAAVGRDSVRYLRESIRSYDDPEPDEGTRSRPVWRAKRPGGPHQPPRPRGFRRLWLENVLAQVFGRVISVALTYLAFVAVALAAAVGSTARWHTNPLGSSWFAIGSTAVVGGLVIAAFLVPVSARVWGRLRLRFLLPDRPIGPPVTTARLAEIADQIAGNTVVYSGYQPFVGSGLVLRRWDLAQRLVRPAEPAIPGLPPVLEADREFPTPPFTAREISEHVRDYISGLANDSVPERRLPALTVDDRIFVAGTEIASLRPYTSEARIVEIIRNPTAPERHYLACQVVSWRGELVTTVYVHFAVQGKALYVELYVTGLLPCDERFRVVDQVGGTGPTAVLRDVGRALVGAPAVVAAAPTALARALGDLLSMGFAWRPSLTKVRKGYDYGATIGLRELGASAEIRDHMQTQDIIKYGRIIERRVLAAILDFLESRGVDVTEYRQRSLTILNAGAVATTGGTVNVSGDAVGTQNVDTQGED